MDSRTKLTPKAGKIIIHASLKKNMILLCFSLGILIIGLLAVYEFGIHWKGTPAVPVFTISTLILFFRLFDRRPKLVIDSQGIFDRTLGLGHIPWDDILSVQFVEVKGASFIDLALRNEPLYLTRFSTFKRKIIEGNKRIGYPFLAINLTSVAADPRAVYDCIFQTAASEKIYRMKYKKTAE